MSLKLFRHVTERGCSSKLYIIVDITTSVMESHFECHADVPVLPHRFDRLNKKTIVAVVVVVIVANHVFLYIQERSEMTRSLMSPNSNINEP